jgi:hypothetical protein
VSSSPWSTPEEEALAKDAQRLTAIQLKQYLTENGVTLPPQNQTKGELVKLYVEHHMSKKSNTKRRTSGIFSLADEDQDFQLQSKKRRKVVSDTGNVSSAKPSRDIQEELDKLR